MPALTKRQVELLVGAIDTDRLLVHVLDALRWTLDTPGRLTDSKDLLAEGAMRLGWTDAQCEALATADEVALAEFAVQLAERRSFGDRHSPPDEG